MRILATLIAALPMAACSRGEAAPAPGPSLFEPIAAVLTHPRCINCHQDQSPRQTDSKILTGRNADRLQRAASELDAVRTAVFDALDPSAVERFFRDLPAPIDHVMVTAGAPHYEPLFEMDVAEVRRALDEHLVLAIQVARHARGKVRPGGTLLFMGGTGARHPHVGLALASTVTNALPALTANLALELAPVRVNLIAAGFVDTPLSASILGEDLENRRNQLRTTLPIRRVVGPADVAALAVHIMTNTALTGGTYDIDGGQQLVRI